MQPWNLVLNFCALIILATSFQSNNHFSTWKWNRIVLAYKKSPSNCFISHLSGSSADKTLIWKTLFRVTVFIQLNCDWGWGKVFELFCDFLQGFHLFPLIITVVQLHLEVVPGGAGTDFFLWEMTTNGNNNETISRNLNLKSKQLLSTSTGVSKL